MNKKYSYRLGFKTSEYVSWIFTYWRLGFNLGEFPISLKSFLEMLIKNIDSNKIYFKWEIKEEK